MMSPNATEDTRGRGMMGSEVPIGDSVLAVVVSDTNPSDRIFLKKLEPSARSSRGQ